MATDITQSEQAEEAHARLAAIIQSSDDAIVSKDLNGVITSWNKGAETIFGYTAGEAIGKSIKMLIPADRQAEEDDILARIRRGESIEHYETIRRRKDGSLLDISLTVSPIVDASGLIIGASKIARDISDRTDAENKIRQSEESYRILAETASDAIIRIDDESIIRYVNRAASNIFGYPASAMIGHSLTMLMPEDLREKHSSGFGRYLKTGKRKLSWESIEVTARHKKGHIFPVEISFGEYHNGDNRFFIGIARDITERKRAQEALRHLSEQLEMRVQTRTGELRDANKALKAQVIEWQKSQDERITLLNKVLTSQEDERRRIARDMHDHFGQQLTALRLHLEILENMSTDESVRQQVLKTKEIASELDSDVSFLVWELRPTALDDLGLKDALSHYIDKWTAQFEIAAEFHVGDLDGVNLSSEAETSLYRIAQEALNNAHKHSKATRTSVVLEKRDGDVILIIEDDGKGIAAKNTNRRKGLGLVGMRERAALVGGTVEIESAPGRGTTIFVRIPVGKPNSNH